MGKRLNHSAFFNVLIVTLLTFFVPVTYAWEREERLGVMAADILPAVLMAKRKPLKNESVITVIVVFKKKSYLSKIIADRLNNLEVKNGRKFSSVSMRYDEWRKSGKGKDENTIFFIIENLGGQLALLLDHANQHNILTYSSRVDDVENGVAAGISVTERVLPAVNKKTLNEINWQFNDLFMRVAKKVN